MPYNPLDALKQIGQPRPMQTPRPNTMVRSQNPAVQGLDGPEWAAQNQGMNPLSSSLSSINPMMDEMKRNLYLEKKYPGSKENPSSFSTGATPVDVNAWEQFLQNSPDIGTDVRARQQATQTNYDESVGQGFRGVDPVAERSRYARLQDETKMNVPVRQQEVQAAGDLAQQQEASRGSLAVAKENTGYKSAQLDALQNMMSGGIQPGGSVSIPGVGSIRTPAATQTPAALARDLAGIRAVYEQNPSEENKIRLDTTIQSIVSRIPVQNPGITDWALEVLKDPKYETFSIDEIIASSDATPEEAEDFRTIMRQVREY